LIFISIFRFQFFPFSLDLPGVSASLRLINSLPSDVQPDGILQNPVSAQVFCVLTRIEPGAETAAAAERECGLNRFVIEQPL
jgi:hypothetical protein